MKVVLMAGGKGTRISELFPNIPKPLIPIEGVPVLEREIISLRDQGFKDIILTIGYMADKIKNYFGDGSKWGVNISYFVEEKPLGNAGALFFLNIEDDFLLLNADAIFDVDFKRMVKYHKEKGGLVTLFTHPNSHPYDSGLIISKENGVVERWLTKEDKKRLSDEAIYLERVLCKEVGGWQDQIAASFGGFNRINFNADGYEVLPVIISPERKRQLNDNLMMFFTGFTRFSSDVQMANNAKTSENKKERLKKMYELVDEAEAVLTNKERDLDDFGRLLDVTWRLKKGKENITKQSKRIICIFLAVHKKTTDFTRK